MVHITHNKHRLLELTIHTICWGLFFGFPLFFTQDDSGSINWKEFINHFWHISFFLRYFLYQLPAIYSQGSFQGAYGTIYSFEYPPYFSGIHRTALLA